MVQEVVREDDAITFVQEEGQVPPPLAPQAFRVNQADLNITVGYNLTANIWQDVWKFRVPIAMEVILQPNNLFSMYLQDRLGQEVGDGTCQVRIEIRDETESERMPIYGPALYVHSKEFQDRDRMARLDLARPVILQEREHLIICARANTEIDADNSYFDLLCSRVVAPIGIRLSTEEEVQKQEALSKEQAEAVAKAKELLKDHIGLAAFNTLKKQGYLEIPSKRYPGYIYRVPRESSEMINMVDSQGKLVDSLCVHPQIACPPADRTLARIVLLESNEEYIIDKANHNRSNRHIAMEVERMSSATVEYSTSLVNRLLRWLVNIVNRWSNGKS